MPRHYTVVVENDNIRINEVTKTGILIDVVHDTDITRFIEQNNVQTQEVNKLTGKKFTSLDIVIPDDDMLETYKMIVLRNPKGTVDNILYEGNLNE